MAEPIGDDLARTHHDASVLVVQVPFGRTERSDELLAALDRALAPDAVRAHAP